MELSKLLKGNKKKSKRLGRGYGSGKGGHTVGRGAKGQKARNKVPAGFEGGQTPLYKRVPQWGGFRSPWAKGIVGVSLSRFNVFRAGSTVTPEDLVEKGMLKKLPKRGVKVLGTGDIKKSLTFSGFAFSESAKKKIEKADGKIKA